MFQTVLLKVIEINVILMAALCMLAMYAGLRPKYILEFVPIYMLTQRWVCCVCFGSRDYRFPKFTVKYTASLMFTACWVITAPDFIIAYLKSDRNT